MNGNVTRLDLLWLVGAIWFGLGVAHDNATLKVGGIVAFGYFIVERRRERRQAMERETERWERDKRGSE